MTRRTTVLTAGTALLLVFGVLGVLLPVPFVAQVPGPTYNTLGEIGGTPIITLEGREPNDASGNLNLTTVGIPQDQLTLVGAVQGWFDDEVVVVPREQVYPSGRSVQETQAENRQAFLTSEQAARGAALAELGYPEAVVVQELAEDSASEGQLEAGDAIDAVGGTPTPDLDALSAVLADTPPGSSVVVDYRRGGAPGTATVTTSPAAEGEGSALGVLVLQTPYAPFDVGIEVADVGGPSAGLMLALGIVDLVGDTDLTEGAVVAGTGTVDTEGVVGPIGGIPLKLVSAREIGAELFLVPAGNCAEAVANPQEGLPTARVETLDDALTALADLRAGRTPTPC